MLNAICVKGFVWKVSPKVGETVRVVNTYLEKHNGKNYYYHTLYGYPDWCGWRVEHFSIQTVISKTELIKEREQSLLLNLIR
jgi:hypothetical protein